MTRWFRGKLGKRLVAVLATAAALVTMSASPAAAGDIKGSYFNPSGVREGAYFFDDHSGNDHQLLVDSTPYGYHVWVRFQVEECYNCGNWSTYIDDLQTGTYSDGRYTVGYIYPNRRFRILIRFYNSNWALQSHTETFYGYHP